jgi:hypothetical protein
MSKRPNPQSNNPHGEHHEDHRDDGKRHVSGEVSISGSVEANIPVTLIEEYKRSNTQTDTREANRDLRDDKRFTVEILTLLFVAFVAFLNIFLAFQAKRTANIADDTLKKSQRPWVNADSFDLKRITLPPDGRFFAYGILTMKNTGTSVATEGWAMMVAVPNETNALNKDWDLACRTLDTQREASRLSAQKQVGDLWPIGFVLAPNQETHSMAFGIGSDMSRQEVASGFYLLGCTRYKDQFSKVHTTRFCFVPNGSTYAPDGTANNITLETCNAFQSAD